mmetsp:Transcript_9707/g.22749  ORF Transcript_9707/g.22749 Transcript_9707/m.22749 type:complete len:302 (-) Transcript_9707:73-978(-)
MGCVVERGEDDTSYSCRCSLPLPTHIASLRATRYTPSTNATSDVTPNHESERDGPSMGADTSRRHSLPPAEDTLPLTTHTMRESSSLLIFTTVAFTTVATGLLAWATLRDATFPFPLGPRHGRPCGTWERTWRWIAVRHSVVGLIVRPAASDSVFAFSPLSAKLRVGCTTCHAACALSLSIISSLFSVPALSPLPPSLTAPLLVASVAHLPFISLWATPTPTTHSRDITRPRSSHGVWVVVALLICIAVAVGLLCPLAPGRQSQAVTTWLLVLLVDAVGLQPLGLGLWRARVAVGLSSKQA